MGRAGRGGSGGGRPPSTLGAAPVLPDLAEALSPDQADDMEQMQPLDEESLTPSAHSPSKSPVSSSELDDTLREPQRMNFNDDETWDSLSRTSDEEHLETAPTPLACNTPTPSSNLSPAQDGRLGSTASNCGRGYLQLTTASASVCTSQERPWPPQVTASSTPPHVPTHQPHPPYTGGTAKAQPIT